MAVVIACVNGKAVTRTATPAVLSLYFYLYRLAGSTSQRLVREDAEDALGDGDTTPDYACA